MKYGSNKISTIEDAVSAFRGHEGVTKSSLMAWVDQFDDEHKSLALKILKNIKYYSAETMRLMIHDLVDKARRSVRLPNYGRMAFVPMGSPWGGAHLIARALRGIRGISSNQIKQQHELANIPNRTRTRAIVLVDIFSGSGQQIKNWWNVNEALLLPWVDKTVQLIIGILVMNHKAADEIQDIIAKKFHISYLDNTCNVLSSESTIFGDREKKILTKYCNKTGCPKKYKKGKGKCALLLAFKHGCPNNSLPILWWEENGWKELFKRRAL